MRWWSGTISPRNIWRSRISNPHASPATWSGWPGTSPNVGTGETRQERRSVAAPAGVGANAEARPARPDLPIGVRLHDGNVQPPRSRAHRAKPAAVHRGRAPEYRYE